MQQNVNNMVVVMYVVIQCSSESTRVFTHLCVLTIKHGRICASNPHMRLKMVASAKTVAYRTNIRPYMGLKHLHMRKGRICDIYSIAYVANKRSHMQTFSNTMWIFFSQILFLRICERNRKCGRKSRIFPHMLTFRAHICAAYKTPQMSHYADYSHKYVPILNNRKIHNPQSLDEDEVKKFAK